MRTLPVLIAAAAIAVSLSACSSSIAAVDGCTPVAGPGNASSVVSATGAVGSAPVVDFPTPLVSAGLQRSVLVSTDGRLVQHGDQVDFEATILHGASGVVLSATGYDGESFGRGPAGKEHELTAALACSHVGDRVAVTGKAIDLSGPGAYTSAGIDDEDTLVIVFDVRATSLGKANGVNQLPVDGMPSVVTAVDGTPGITLTDPAPPTELRTSVIKLGGGRVVEAGDTIVVHYSVWDWPAQESGRPVLGDSTWSRGIAASFPATSESLPEAFLTAVIGAPVGSQLLAVVPASEDGSRGAQIMVIDLLGILD